jgi:hypothetical protein
MYGDAISIAVISLLIGVVGKIIWDWLNRRSEIPRASTGFISLDELTEHCRRQQAGCVQLLRTEVKLLASKIDGRLGMGDHHFDSYDRRLEKIEKQLEKLIKMGKINGRDDDDIKSVRADT